MSERIERFMQRPEQVEPIPTLHALLNPEELTPGTEGFGSFVGDLIRNVKHGRKKSIKGKMDEKSVANLKATYQNSSWLDKRRFMTGEVVINAVGGLFKKKLDTELNELYQHLEGLASKNRSVVLGALAKVQPAINFVLGPNAYKEDTAASFLKGLSLKGDYKFATFDKTLPAKEKIKLPALTKDEIKTAVELVLKISEERVAMDPFFSTEWLKALYVENNGQWWPRFAPESKVWDEAAAVEAYSTCDICEAIDNFRYDVEDIYDLQTEVNYKTAEAYLAAMIAWIDASVK